MAPRGAPAAGPPLRKPITTFGSAVHRLDRFEDAQANFEHALRLRPDYPEAHVNRPISCSAAGDLARGWPEYEWRLKTRAGGATCWKQHDSQTAGRCAASGQEVWVCWSRAWAIRSFSSAIRGYCNSREHRCSWNLNSSAPAPSTLFVDRSARRSWRAAFGMRLQRLSDEPPGDFRNHPGHHSRHGPLLVC